MQKFTFLFALLFVIVIPTFALESSDTEKEIVSLDSPVLETGTTEINKVIHDLNIEFDRLSLKGYSHEDYDLSESGANLIINAVLPIDGSSLSDTEVREYLVGRVYLVDELEKYATGLESDSERAIFFHNAAWYTNELVHAD